MKYVIGLGLMALGGVVVAAGAPLIGAILLVVAVVALAFG